MAGGISRRPLPFPWLNFGKCLPRDAESDGIRSENELACPLNVRVAPLSS